MKVYKVVVKVLDFEDVGADQVIQSLESAEYVSAKVMSLDSREIGKWHDKHPLNYSRDHKSQMYFNDLFGEID